MSDTTDSGADPWGLPEPEAPPTADTGTDEVSDRPETAEPEPVESVHESTATDNEIESAMDVPAEDAAEDIPPPPPPATPRGPLSGMLAASGLFGGSPVPMPDESDEPQTPDFEDTVDDVAETTIESIDVGALEVAETPQEATPPDLAAPTSGATFGIGATDADLPLEPPQWMTPVLDTDATIEPIEIAEASGDLFPSSDTDAIAEISFSDPIFGVDDLELPVPEFGAESESPESPLGAVEALETESVDDAEMETLVAELAGSELETVDIDAASEAAESIEAEEKDDEFPSLEGFAADITFDPSDTPSVYQQLEELPQSESDIEPTVPEVAAGHTDEIVAELAAMADPAGEIVAELAAVADPADDAAPELAAVADPADDAAPELAAVADPAEEAAAELPAADPADDVAPELPAAVDSVEAPADENADEPERPEWEIFEYSVEPVESDAPVFGVSFGNGDDSEESTDAEEIAEQPAEETAAESLEDAFGQPTEQDAVEPPAEETGYTDVQLPDSELFVSEDPTIPEEAAAGADDNQTALRRSGLGRGLDALISQNGAGSEDQSVDESPSDIAASTQIEAEPAIAEASPIEWGSRWQESAQGWVEDDQGRSTWRPIVTTSPLLSEWHIDTYLGVVAADVVLGSGPIDLEMAAARTSAMKTVVDEAMMRGAHAVVGVSTRTAAVGAATVLTATGTAVTLKAQE